ncbi:tRNA pseudouridine55 synthase [Natronocella acetinitrilica]|uniref:tRNA pseudouridine synthase B n=1 Tax=Natronocella acetinitrilica TaxID=414046 RepID=A0AAE3KCB5_9GAMM|nr:tRNA pseudouridine55 synthase [Natronocella acetinitrilica]
MKTGGKIQRRRVDGILLFDKPSGETSNRSLQRVKRLYNAKKAGHTGSLDPLATGLLPICFGEATKVSGFLLDADKTYSVRCRLGVTTDTGDAEGAIREQRALPPGLDVAMVEAALPGFRGDIMQIPPMYSALKHEGRRLYTLARRGEEVERKPRAVSIHSLVLTLLNEDELGLEVVCSKGTYVRTLVEDIGAALGCGAHVTALRRTGLGPFTGLPMVTFEELRARAENGPDALDELLLPPEAALVDWPAVHLPEDAAHYLQQGQPVWVPKAPAGGMVRVFGPTQFLGMGAVLDDGRVAPKRLLAT